MELTHYVFVLEVYTGHRYEHLVHHLEFDFTHAGFWGAKLLCSGTIVDGGMLPVRDNNFSKGLPVTCLTCLVNAGLSL